MSFALSPRSIRLLAATGAASLATALLMTPASANEANTDATFTITEGTGELFINVPGGDGAVDLGSADFGGALIGDLGEVAVTDNRSSVYKTWEVSVQGTDFIAELDVDGGGTETATAPASDMTYDPEGLGAVGGNLEDGLGVPQTANLGEGGTVMTFTGGLLILSGNATWNPSIELDMSDMDEQLPPGEYLGTITHSLIS